MKKATLKRIVDSLNKSLKGCSFKERLRYQPENEAETYTITRVNIGYFTDPYVRGSRPVPSSIEVNALDSEGKRHTYDFYVILDLLPFSDKQKAKPLYQKRLKFFD